MEIKLPPIESSKIIIREEYIDTDGHIKDDEREITIRLPKVDNTPEPCKNCPTHPSNGGDGICHCTLGLPKIT